MSKVVLMAHIIAQLLRAYQYGFMNYWRKHQDQASKPSNELSQRRRSYCTAPSGLDRHGENQKLHVLQAEKPRPLTESPLERLHLLDMRIIPRLVEKLPVVGKITQAADDAVLDDVEVVLALRRQ